MGPRYILPEFPWVGPCTAKEEKIVHWFEGKAGALDPHSRYNRPIIVLADTGTYVINKHSIPETVKMLTHL